MGKRITGDFHIKILFSWLFEGERGQGLGLGD